MSTEPGKVVNVNSATLIMGATGTGKTSLLATLMEYVYETYGLLTMFYTTDGGGYPTKVQALIRQGICWPWRMRTRDLPDGSLSFETCYRATQNWWPKRINLATGETTPGVELVPPVTEKYEMRCPNDHLLKTVQFQSMLTPQLCPICKVHTTKENMRVVKSSARTKGFEKIGAVAYDGLTSMIAWMLSDMGQRSGRLELKGEEAAIGGKVISGNMKFGGTTRSHVGFAQDRSHELVLNSLGIPFLVVPPVFTALTLETTDEGGLSIRGPKLAGRAKTDEAPAWFGNCLESAVGKTEKEERQFRLYLEEYVDGAGVRHLVKHRGAPGTMPPYLEDPPVSGDGGTAFGQFNLGVFFQLLNAGMDHTMDDYARRYPHAPGLPAGVMEVGEGAASPRARSEATAQTVVATAVPSIATAGVPDGAMPSSTATPGPKDGGVRRAPAPAPRAAAPKRAVAPVTPVPPAASETPAVGAHPNGDAAVSPQTAAPASTETPASSPGTAASMSSMFSAPSSRPPATRGAWAPPGAPRPPAPAPRVGTPKPSST